MAPPKKERNAKVIVAELLQYTLPLWKSPLVAHFGGDKDMRQLLKIDQSNSFSQVRETRSKVLDEWSTSMEDCSTITGLR